MSQIPLGPIAWFILDPKHTDMCRFSQIIYFGFNVHSGELDVSLAGCFREKGCVVYASVDATGADHLWVVPAILSSPPCLLENEGSCTESFGGHWILFWEGVLNTMSFPLTRQKRMPFEKWIPVCLTTAFCSLGSLCLCHRLNGELLCLWSIRVRTSREEAKQPLMGWVWNILWCQSTWRCTWITVSVL